MLLKIGKTTPWCPKRLLDDEYTGESWSLRQIHRGVDILVYLNKHQNGLQKNFWWSIKQGVKTPQCINHRGVLTPWCILYQQVFCKLILGQLPCVFITDDSRLPSDEYTWESRFYGGEYTGGVNYKYNKTPRIFEKCIFYIGKSNGTEVDWWKNQSKKSRDTVSLSGAWNT